MMKHKDIYEKFMIEYDKALIASSYPSLTKYEIATVLDKAYLALVAQKVTGNNARGVAFEGDTKAVEDVRPLLVSTEAQYNKHNQEVNNEYTFSIPEDMLYYIQSLLTVRSKVPSIDSDQPQVHTKVPVTLVDHITASRFMATDYNLPWIKVPVCFLDSVGIHVLIDSYKYKKEQVATKLMIIYVKIPNKFVGDSDDTEFELSDTMAEELINLAIILSAEIVESLRQQTKATFRPLES